MLLHFLCCHPWFCAVTNHHICCSNQQHAKMPCSKTFCFHFNVCDGNSSLSSSKTAALLFLLFSPFRRTSPLWNNWTVNGTPRPCVREDNVLRSATSGLALLVKLRSWWRPVVEPSATHIIMRAVVQLFNERSPLTRSFQLASTRTIKLSPPPPSSWSLPVRQWSGVGWGWIPCRMSSTKPYTHTHTDISSQTALLQMAILSSPLTLLTHCETKLKELHSSFFLQGHN